MTMIQQDGFDHYGSAAVGLANMVQGPWASVPGSGPGAPAWGARTGEYAIQNGGGDTSYRRVLAAPENILFVTCGFSVADLPDSDLRHSVIRFLNGGGAVIAGLWLDNTGSLSLRNSVGAVLAATQGPVVVGANWHFLEMKIDTTADTFTLRIDDADGTGTPVIAATGLAFASDVSQYDVLYTASASSGFTTAWLDDLTIKNDAGTVNNDFGGDTRVATLFMREDDPAEQGWTPRYRKMYGAGILDNRAASTSCVTAAASTSTDLGAADFTIEGFVRFFALPAGSTKAQILGKWDETANQRSYQLYLGGPTLDSGQLCFRTSTDGTAGTVAQKILWPWTPDLNVKYHVAMVRTAGELLLFIDGVQYGLPITDGDTYFAGSATLALGAQHEGAAAGVANTAFTGFTDEVRLTIGVGRYTTAFTPTAPFGRNVGDDPDFADVALLCGFDSGIFDESSFARALTARGGSVQITPDDGPAIGAFSAINQHTPRDDTFIEAALVAASSTLTLDAQPANNDTVRVGTTDGATPAVYRFRTVLASAYDVLIDASTDLTLQNLYNAINQGPGSGTKYSAGTIANFDVSASELPGDQMLVTALTPGTAGNAIATTVTLTNGGAWDGATLAGGENIPGPSDFYFDRPPPLTTVVKAVTVVMRGYKSDAGTASVQSSFVGPLGADDAGAVHALTLSPNYYDDTFEEDPDTGDAITPTTLVGGRVRFTRTA